MSVDLIFPENWVRVPFEEAIDFQEGPGILAKDFRPYGVPLIRLAGLSPGVNVLDGCDYLDAEMVAQRWQHFRVVVGDVLLSTSASLGRIAIVDEESAGAIPYTGIIRMRPAMSGLRAAFIPYLLESEHFQRQVEAMGVGSVIRHFGPTHLRQMYVIVPDEKTQDVTVDILGSLDDKIELNQQMNETLEEMARAVFKSWFVDFDPVRAKAEGRQPEGMDAETAALFPNRLVESELGLIPEGWEPTTLGGITAKFGGFVQTGPFGSQLHASDYVMNGMPVVMPKDIKARRIVTEGIARIQESDAERLSKHRLLAGDLVYSRRGDVERHAHVSEVEVGWLCGTGCLLVRPGSGCPSSLFVSLAVDRPESRAWVSQRAVGATMQNLNTAILSALPILLPTNDLLAAFSAVAGPMEDLTVQRAQESQTLAALRDLLLPKLISGELRIPDAERLLSEAP